MVLSVKRVSMFLYSERVCAKDEDA